MKYHEMKCFNCHKIIGKYAALSLPTMIVYFVCEDCVEVHDKYTVIEEDKAK